MPTPIRCAPLRSRWPPTAASHPTHHPNSEPLTPASAVMTPVIHFVTRAEIISKRSSDVALCARCRWPAQSLFLQGELVDIDVAHPEHLGAAGQVPHVALVDLFGLNLDGLILVRLKGLGPQVKGPGVMVLQRLGAGQRETRLRRALL